MDKLLILLLGIIAIAHGAKSIITQQVDFTLFKYKKEDVLGRETDEEVKTTVPLTGGIAVLIGILEIAGALVFIIFAIFSK